jgi:hypothetical protein
MESVSIKYSSIDCELLSKAVGFLAQKAKQPYGLSSRSSVIAHHPMSTIAASPRANFISFAFIMLF